MFLQHQRLELLLEDDRNEPVLELFETLGFISLKA